MADGHAGPGWPARNHKIHCIPPNSPRLYISSTDDYKQLESSADDDVFLHHERYALTTLSPDAPDPQWARGRFVSIARTSRAVSVICDQQATPAGLKSQPDFCCLEIDGDFPLESVGIVAAATAPLANAAVSVFVISVWSTDFIFLAGVDLIRATDALQGAGHTIVIPEVQE